MIKKEKNHYHSSNNNNKIIIRIMKIIRTIIIKILVIIIVIIIIIIIIVMIVKKNNKIRIIKVRITCFPANCNTSCQIIEIRLIRFFRPKKTNFDEFGRFYPLSNFVNHSHHYY